MKKALVLFCMLAMLIVGSDVFAGSIDYLTNQSPEYMMSFTRTAATDSADIANYNPAGTVFMAKNGLYLNAGVQYLMKPYEQTAGGTTYEQDEPSIIPNFYAVYKQDDWAAFFSFTVPAGGGKLKWDDGDATTAALIAKTAAGAAALAGGTGATTINSQSIEAESMYFGLTLGGAYKINNMISVSLAGRYIISQRAAKASANFAMDAVGAVPGNESTVVIDSDFEYEAQGFGGIIGVDIRPIEGLTIGLRYETVTKLEYEYTMNTRSATVSGPVPAVNTGVQNSLLTTLAGLDKDGQKLQYDLPALLSVGAEYVVMPGLTVGVTGVYYFIKQADWEGAEDNFENGWEAAISVAYQVMPDLKVSAGFNWTESGAQEDAIVPENPSLDSWSVGLGAMYNVMPDLTLTLAGSRTQYVTDEFGEGAAEIEYKKVVWNMAFGVQYRMDM
jgi:long-chain fatty acid transport protein